VERACFLLRVSAERLEEYRERHRAVWEPMLAALRESGWHNYSLFLRPDGLLVGCVECEDFGAAQRAMEQTDFNARWQADMAPLFDLPEGSRPDTGGERLEEIFHLD
jgi:L-rhamnose mutarotase